MKRSILATAFVAATFWIANTPAFAQHGRPASPGAVAPSMHGGASSGESHASSRPTRSEEHTSELQSRLHLVCRLLLEKKKPTTSPLARRNNSPAFHTPTRLPVS